MHVSKVLSDGAKRIGRVFFFNVCMEGVEMNQHIRLAHIVGQLRRVGQSVEEIGLKTIEWFDAKRDAKRAGSLGGRVEAFYGSFPFVVGPRPSTHHAQGCIERATNELAPEFRRTRNALRVRRNSGASSFVARS